MWHLYLDESGDLGFDFVNKKPSKFFTVTILAISSDDHNRRLFKAAKKTIARKLNARKNRNRIVIELKGSQVSLEVKKYLMKQLQEVKFGIYSYTLNKKQLFSRLVNEKERVYNYIARKVLDEIPFEQFKGSRVEFVIDRCKGKPEIEEFNSYIRAQLSGRLDPKIPLDIHHLSSHESFGLQVCDMFSWGIFNNHERGRKDWYDEFKDRVRFDKIFL